MKKGKRAKQAHLSLLSFFHFSTLSFLEQFFLKPGAPQVSWWLSFSSDPAKDLVPSRSEDERDKYFQNVRNSHCALAEL